jgi:hypothetical protein
MLIQTPENLKQTEANEMKPVKEYFNYFLDWL